MAAADSGLLLAVRGGGHSIPGWSVCEGGLMIDLSPMKAVQVDAQRRIAHCEPGVLALRQAWASRRSTRWVSSMRPF